MKSTPFILLFSTFLAIASTTPASAVSLTVAMGKDGWDIFFGFATVLAPLFGFGGLIWSVLLSARKQREQRDRDHQQELERRDKTVELERRALAGALLGEVSALKMIVERRHYLEWAQALIDRIDSGEWNKPDHFIGIKAQQNYFTVFEHNTGRLGLLPKPLPEQIAHLYAVCRSVLDDLTHMDIHVQAGPERLRHSLKEMAELMRDALALSDYLMERLEAVADGRPILCDEKNEDIDSAIPSEEGSITAETARPLGQSASA